MNSNAVLVMLTMIYIQERMAHSLQLQREEKIVTEETINHSRLQGDIMTITKTTQDNPVLLDHHTEKTTQDIPMKDMLFPTSIVIDVGITDVMVFEKTEIAVDLEHKKSKWKPRQSPNQEVQSQEKTAEILLLHQEKKGYRLKSSLRKKFLGLESSLQSHSIQVLTKESLQPIVCLNCIEYSRLSYLEGMTESGLLGQYIKSLKEDLD